MAPLRGALQLPVGCEGVHLNRWAFYVGCHAGVTDQEVDHILECMRSYFQKNV